MKQTLLMKGRSLMLTVLFTLSLATLIVLSGAASKAEAQSAAPDLSATNTVIEQLEDDGKLNSDVSEQLEAATSTASPSASASASATASPSAPSTAPASASPSASAIASPSAPATASAAQDQYKELPDTSHKAVAPAETTEAMQLPNTGPGTDGKAAAPAETTEATGPSETNRNSVLPFMLGFGALLVSGGLLARRLIR
jgi:outer membrane murein-binding lipoprotein Lpp